MGDRQLVDNYNADLFNLLETLSKLTNNYRLMIGGASDLNQITLAHKRDVTKALKRVRVVGDMIDEVLEVLSKSELTYLKYCKIKSDLVSCMNELDFVKAELEDLVKRKEDK